MQQTAASQKQTDAFRGLVMETSMEQLSVSHRYSHQDILILALCAINILGEENKELHSYSRVRRKIPAYCRHPSMLIYWKYHIPHPTKQTNEKHHPKEKLRGLLLGGMKLINYSFLPQSYKGSSATDPYTLSSNSLQELYVMLDNAHKQQKWRAQSQRQRLCRTSRNRYNLI